MGPLKNPIITLDHIELLEYISFQRTVRVFIEGAYVIELDTKTEYGEI
jgi:hypothetical protein